MDRGLSGSSDTRTNDAVGRGGVLSWAQSQVNSEQVQFLPIAKRINMFVCDYCREHALEEKGLCIGKSKGACELCDYYDTCNDLRGYQCKKNWQELVYKQ